METSRQSVAEKQVKAARTATVSITVIFLLIGISRSDAQWSIDSTTNTAVCTASGIQSAPVACGDGTGGIYVAWEDHRNSDLDIYAQRLTLGGVQAWQAAGIPVCIAGGYQKLLAAASDGTGGMLLAWRDERVSQYDANIYAQRIDSAGNLLWASTGVAVCTASSNQSYPAIVSDGDGGAIVAWIDDRTAYQTDVYAQHLDASGTVKWAANGIQVRAKAGSSPYPRLLSDEKGGVIVAWNQSDPNLSNKGVYAQRIDSSGALQWANDGVAVKLTNAQFPFPSGIPDGAGGAILTWAEPLGTAYNDIVAQRIDGAGNLLWGAEGVSVCTAAGSQNTPELTSDSHCGTIITWTDTRAGGSNGDIYAQRIDSSGAAVWKTNGLAICAAPGYQQSQKVVSDGLGGALIAWRDQRSGTYYRIYAQRIDRGGDLVWRTDGIPVSFKNGDDQALVMVPDLLGGAVISWEYYTAFDIYAKHITGAGALGNPSLMAPAQYLPQVDAAGLSTAPAFSWAPVVGATSYQLQVATDFTFSGALAFNDSTITDTVAAVEGLVNNTTYFWRVRARNGSMVGPYSSDRRFLTVISGVEQEDLAIPQDYGLSQNYPNPFNPTTTIQFALPHRSHVTLIVFNSLGQKVATLIDAESEAGYHTVQFSAVGGSASGGKGRNLGSGVYFCRMQAGDFIQTLKLCLIK